MDRTGGFKDNEMPLPDVKIRRWLGALTFRIIKAKTRVVYEQFGLNPTEIFLYNDQNFDASFHVGKGTGAKFHGL